MNGYVRIAEARIGDRVLIGGEPGTVTRLQQTQGLLIVSAASDHIASDGEGSLLIEAVELTTT